MSTTQYLQVQDDGHGIGGTAWNTVDNPDCQVYIANWTDSSIWLYLNAPTGVYGGFQTSVLMSTLDDASPLTLFNTTACPVVSGDGMTFTVTNPQGGGATKPYGKVTVTPFTGWQD